MNAKETSLKLAAILNQNQGLGELGIREFHPKRTELLSELCVKFVLRGHGENVAAGKKFATRDTD